MIQFWRFWGVRKIKGHKRHQGGTLTFFAPCSSSTPSPMTTYTTFLPNLWIILSKQLSFPNEQKYIVKKCKVWVSQHSKGLNFLYKMLFPCFWSKSIVLVQTRKRVLLYAIWGVCRTAQYSKNCKRTTHVVSCPLGMDNFSTFSPPRLIY